MIRKYLVALLGLSTLALGHPNQSLQPHDLAHAWSFDPGVVAPLLLTGLLFFRGARAERGVSRVQFLCFWTGWVVLAAALISPLHPLGETLFCAHMAQHELLMVVAAPLLVFSRPLVPMLWGLPLSWRKTLGQTAKAKLPQCFWRFLTEPINAWSIHFAALWGWHLPVLFQATLTSEWIHAAQHVSFFASALLFWWSLLYARSRASYGASVLYIFTTAVHTSILGALLTFAQTVWYPAYLTTTLTWGLTPLEDQQLGGLIMWMPAGLVYLGAGLWVFALWLRESDLAAKGREYAR
jgi:putative membrane protein